MSQQARTPRAQNQPRYTLYLKLRQSSKSSLLKSLRQSYIKEQQNSQLEQLIESTQQSKQISQLQVRMLIEIILSGRSRDNSQNAIIHLGNLFIDGVLDQRLFQHFGIQWLKNVRQDGRYYEWLLNVFIIKGCLDFSFEIYHRSFVSIHLATDQFKIINCLKCATFLIKHVDQFNSTYLLQHFPTKSLTFLLSKTSSPSKQLTLQSYKFFHSLLNSPLPGTIKSVLQSLCPHKILLLIKNGLHNNSPHIRALACQILSNNLSILFELVQFQDLMRYVWDWIVLLDADQERDCVKVEVSFLVLGVVQGAVGGLGGLGRYCRILGDIGDRNAVVKENFGIICQFLTNICYNTQPTSQEEEDYLIRIRIEMSSLGLLLQDTEI